MSGTGVQVRNSDLTYDKYGTRIAGPDEGDDSLQRFAFDGAKALAEAKGWELLPGPVERVPVGVYDGEEVFAYLWPVARSGPRPGEFCHEHFSWLCQAGQGQCQRDTRPNAPGGEA